VRTRIRLTACTMDREALVFKFITPFRNEARRAGC
jgi:hypothetical protein